MRYFNPSLTIIIRVLGLFIALQKVANATFTSADLRPPFTDDLITVDSQTGLEWLDLRETLGMSINDARASDFVQVDGFRVATAQEVLELLKGAGLSAGVFSRHVTGEQSSTWVSSVPPDPNTEAATASDAIRTFFGSTFSTPTVSFSTGLFLRYPGVTEVGFARAALNASVVTSKSVSYRVDLYSSGLDASPLGYGVFLVRSTPASRLRDWYLTTFGDDLTTIDDNTRMEWLDLTLTQGMSVAEAMASTYVVNDGFRVATAHEVDVLFESAGFAPAVFSPDVSGLQSDGWASTIPFDPNRRAALASDSLLAQFGTTYSVSPVIFSGGYFLNEEGSDVVGYARAYRGSAFTTTKGAYFNVDLYPAGLAVSSSSYGVFLVRPYGGHRFESASLVPGENDHLVTIDLNTGLEWLDLTLTTGCSVGQTESSSLAVLNGFRVATAAEVDLLFESAGILPSTITHDAPGSQTDSWVASFPIDPNASDEPVGASIDIRHFFGRTSDTPGVQSYSKGWFFSDSGSPDVGSGRAYHLYYINTVYSITFHGDAEPSGLAVTNDNTGVFLVRGINAASSARVEGYTFNRNAGLSLINFRGAPNTAYQIKKTKNLRFDNPGIPPLSFTKVFLGTQDGNYVITDENGDASVEFALDFEAPNQFIQVARP